jgi:quinoprotein glucose dehydrogenase
MQRSLNNLFLLFLLTTGALMAWVGTRLALLMVGGIGLAFQVDRTPAAHSEARGPAPANPADGEWIAYGNDRGGSRYFPLAQITPANVGNLRPAGLRQGLPSC